MVLQYSTVHVFGALLLLYKYVNYIYYGKVKLYYVLSVSQVSIELQQLHKLYRG